MRKVIKRQRTILGAVIRDVERKLLIKNDVSINQLFSVWLERCKRIVTQQKHDKNKLYALHAPEVECISKGKARTPYEFGVKVGIAIVAAKGMSKGLVLGARSFVGRPYDGDTLAEQLEQVENITGYKPHTAIVDLGYQARKVTGVEILHRRVGKGKDRTAVQKYWLKRRQAVEPTIGHMKQDCGMGRCYLQGAKGDAIHAVLCAAGYNLRLLLRWLRFLWLLQVPQTGLLAVMLRWGRQFVTSLQPKPSSADVYGCGLALASYANWKWKWKWIFQG